MSLTGLPNAFVEEEPLKSAALERLNKLAVPTLVIVGELDDDIIKTMGELLAARIPEAPKVIFSGAAHLPNMEKPEEFSQKVIAFLQQVTNSKKEQTIASRR